MELELIQTCPLCDGSGNCGGPTHGFLPPPECPECWGRGRVLKRPDGSVERVSDTVEMICAELEELRSLGSNKLVAKLKQDLLNERRMWKSAVNFVLQCPRNLDIVGNPNEINEVRETLRPVADLVIRLEDIAEMGLDD